MRTLPERPANASGFSPGAIGRLTLEQPRIQQARERGLQTARLRHLAARRELIDRLREQVRERAGKIGGMEPDLLRKLLDFVRTERLLDLDPADRQVRARTDPRLHLRPQPTGGELLHEPGEADAGSVILNQFGQHNAHPVLAAGGVAVGKSAARGAGELGKKAHGFLAGGFAREAMSARLRRKVNARLTPFP